MTQAGCRIRWQARNPGRKLTAARDMWTKEEDDALDALMEGCTSWAELPKLLKTDKGLAARGRVSFISLLASMTNPPCPPPFHRDICSVQELHPYIRVQSFVRWWRRGLATNGGRRATQTRSSPLHAPSGRMT